MLKQFWFRPLVWMYRLAVVFAVVIPVILLLWAFVQKSRSDSTLINYLLASIKFAGNHDLPVDRRPASGLYFRLMAHPHSICSVLGGSQRRN